jgi:hypothetical protein
MQSNFNEWNLCAIKYHISWPIRRTFPPENVT